MRSRINLESTQEELGIDMTPMLDVVFIMLIFFIVSTTFVRDEGVEINRPTASNASTQKNQGIVLSIDTQGLVWLNQNSMPISQLSANLTIALAQKTQPSVLIKADTNTATGDLISVLDLVKSLGVEKVVVATKQER